MSARRQIYVAVGLDVEEEGLFGGHYECLRPQTTNVAALERLSPFLARGVRPTLFCAYSVLADSAACGIIRGLAGRAEIGAHLHHWNTPPLAQNIPESGVLDTVPSNQISLSLMKSKLHALLDLCQRVSGAQVRSFRMGRWDLYGSFLPLLAHYGIRCDASVRPLHMASHPMFGPDHFAAPPDPYWINLPGGRILEVPLTVVPILPLLRRFASSFAKLRWIGASVHKWGALSLLPVQHPLWVMQLTTKSHVRNGGRVLSLTWHSSEMMPGATPHLKNPRSVESFLKKILAYLDWLEKAYTVTYVTVGELSEINGFTSAGAAGAGSDWNWLAEQPDVF